MLRQKVINQQFLLLKLELIFISAEQLRIASLAERLREIGIADTDTTNDANDTAANAEATSLAIQLMIL